VPPVPDQGIRRACSSDSGTCQQGLAERGIPRPPMSEQIRREREAFTFPSREEDIPLHRSAT